MPRHQCADLAYRGLYPFSHVFLDEGHRRGVLAFGIRFPADRQIYLFDLPERILDLIVGVPAVPVQRTFGRQVVVHPFEYLRIVLGTLRKVHLHRDAVGGGHQLYLHPIEMLALGCVVAPVFLVPEEFATTYAYIVAGLHGKGVDDVFHLAAHVLEYPADAQQDEHQGLLQFMQAFGETALFEHTAENMALHITQRHRLVATEVECRHHCRSDYLSVREFPVIVFAMVHFFQ